MKRQPKLPAGAIVPKGWANVIATYWSVSTKLGPTKPDTQQLQMATDMNNLYCLLPTPLRLLRQDMTMVQMAIADDSPKCETPEEWAAYQALVKWSNKTLDYIDDQNGTIDMSHFWSR